MNRQKIYPLLSPGDTVGLITPASFITEEQLKQATKNIKSLGLKPFFCDSISDRKGYFAGSDKQRLKELHRMYAEKNVKAVICVRGGYGTTRLLEKIDYNLIKKNPKPLIGYSDITALLNAVYLKTKLPAFHGTNAAGEFTDYTSENFVKMFFETSENIDTGIFADHKKDAFVINSGNACGKLTGGNLALITSTLGTPFEIKTENKILFLEDIAEAPYKIDRMLTQLISAGKFKKVKGVIFGKFSGCEAKDKDSSFSLREVITERIKPLKIPGIYGFSFGHIKNRAVLPVGVNACFDAENFSIFIKRKEINRFFC